jgi:hypothetical protein
MTDGLAALADFKAERQEFEVDPETEAGAVDTDSGESRGNDHENF